jgi:hypothetical protein
MLQKLTGPTHDVSERGAPLDAGKLAQPVTAAHAIASAIHLFQFGRSMPVPCAEVEHSHWVCAIGS